MLILEIWTNPSTPGSNSTKAPKSLILTTFPNTADPSGYFSSILLHGSGVKALILNEILFFSLSASMILTSTIWPFLSTLSADLTWLHDISDKCINPSTPFISANAPKFVNLLTSALTISPTFIFSHAASSIAFLASSRITLLEATTLTGFSIEKSINLTSNSVPTKLLLSLENLTSTCDEGTKILTPS